MNVKLLRKVKKHILEEPRRFLMRTWAIKSYSKGDRYLDDRNQMQSFPKCGTAACVAGWSCILADKQMPDGAVMLRAKELLSLDSHQACRLFSDSAWPSQFYLRYTRAKTPKTRAKIAAERIEHFIATKGAE